MPKSCNSTNCSLKDMEQIQENINTHCEPIWDRSSGVEVLSRVLNCNDPFCRENLTMWMDNCMCIPEYCGWKGADPSQRKDIFGKRERSFLPPATVDRLDHKIQQIHDWCWSANYNKQRLKCPPVNSEAYLSDIDYDCRFTTRNPDPTTWTAQWVKDGESAPLPHGWRISSLPPGTPNQLGPGCHWDNNCNQVCGHYY